MEFSHIDSKSVIEQIKAWAKERNKEINLMNLCQLSLSKKNKDDLEFFSEFISNKPQFFIDFINECLEILKVNSKDISFDIYSARNVFTIVFYWYDDIFISQTTATFHICGIFSLVEKKLKTPKREKLKQRLLKEYTGHFTMASFN